MWSRGVVITSATRCELSEAPKKIIGEGGATYRYCTTHGTGISVYPHCRETCGSSYVFHGAIIHGLKGDNHCLLAPLHSKPSVKLQQLSVHSVTSQQRIQGIHWTKNKSWSAPSELLVGCRSVSHCTHCCGSFTDIFSILHAASCLSVFLQSRTKLPQRWWSTNYAANLSHQLQ